MRKQLNAIQRLIAWSLLALSCSAQAAVEWQWQMTNGSGHVAESGTIITDGALSDLASPHVFTITAFNLTYSESRPTAVNTAFNLGTQLPETIVWNGSAISQFTRSSYTNGANFYSPTTDTRVAIDVNFGRILTIATENTVFAAAGTSVVPVSPGVGATPVPVPMHTPQGLVLMVGLMGALAFAARRRGVR